MRSGYGFLIGAMFGSASCMVGGLATDAARRPDSAELDPVAVQRAWDVRPATQTNEFSIRTSLAEHSEAALVKEADALLGETEEIVRQVLDLSPRGPHKVRLSVFATPEEYKAYVAAIMTPSLRDSYVQHSGGFFSTMRNEIVVGCRSEGCRGALVHEFTHALAGRTFFMSGGERVNWGDVMPPWLNEGLAEYVTSRVAPESGYSWQVVDTALNVGTLTPLMTLTDPESRPLEHQLFYPSAWALTTFLLDRNASGPAQVKRYLQVLKTRRFAKDQFTSVFGLLEEVEPAWHRFIASGGKRE